MNASGNLLRRGAVAGVVAATAVIVWFLGIDLLAGQAFRTPAFLARVLLGTDGAAFGTGAIAIYTVVHYLVFIVIGSATAWLVYRMEAAPPVLLGLALGFLLFDLVFYGSVLLTGVDVVQALGWPAVLTGNLIAGVVMLSTLAALGVATPVNWRETLAQHYTIREGLLAGLLGAVLVAIWFLAVDTVAGRPLFTPAALGSAMLGGARSAGDVEVTALPILGYTTIHVFAFLLTGLVAAALFAAAEEVSEVVLLGGVLLFGVFEVFSIGLLAIVSQWLIDALAWWNIAIANFIAAAGMGIFLMRRHPKLMYDLTHQELEEDLAHDGDGEVVAAGPSTGGAAGPGSAAHP